MNEEYLDVAEPYRSELLVPLTKKAVKWRKEAIEGRKKKGLDRIWRLAREQYQGVDELNRPAQLEGAMTLDGPLTTMRKVDAEARSTVFVNITRPYTDSAVARVTSLYLPTNKMPWDLKKTPVSDLEIVRNAVAKHPELELLVQLFPPLMERLAFTKEEEEARMERAKLYIKDWLTECGWLSEMRMLIEEAGITGTGVLKGPWPKGKELDKDIQAFLEMMPMQIREELRLVLAYSPHSECVKVENCFPDPSCGRNIQNGRFFFEQVPDVSRRKLEEWAKQDDYLPDQIAHCLHDGPQSVTGMRKDKSSPFEVWIMHAQVCEDDLEYGGESEEGGPLDADEGEDITHELSETVFLNVVLCNDRIIKVVSYYLDKQCFPYDVLQWKPRENCWTGIGVPEQIETPQRGVNAATRALQDNLGYAVGPQVVEWQGVIEPVNGNPELTPYKRWRFTGDGVFSTLDDVKKAFVFLEFPFYGDKILPLIQFWQKTAEDTSNLPMILQGQAASDRVGVTQQQLNAASENLRLIVKALDDVTARHITRYYEWLQLYGPDDAKGDATVEAIGSSVLLVKELQQQALLQIGTYAKDPAYGLSPKKWMQAYLEGFQLEAAKLAPDEQEMQQLQEVASQPDPRIQAEQIKAETSKWIAQLEDRFARMELELKAQLKGIELDNAKAIVNTQVSGQIEGEALRQQGAQEKEVVKAAVAPEKETETKAALATPPKAPPEPDLDEALSMLGLGGE